MVQGIQGMSLPALSVTAAIALLVSACAAGSAPAIGTAAPPAGPTTPAAGTATTTNQQTQGSPTQNLTIYAAASLKAALAKAKTAYEASHVGTTLTISTDSSTALETQIDQGAPADVFLSADTANPQKLIDKGLAGGGLTTFAGNLLTVIVPAANPAGIRTAADLARPNVKIIAAGDAVPITRYANALVANLATQAGYGTDFAAAYRANIASREDNVASIVARIELAEGDAGIVYVTDAKSSTKVASVPLPPAANVPATYAGIVVRASKNPDSAKGFLTWLAGPDGQAILATFGFIAPPS